MPCASATRARTRDAGRRLPRHRPGEVVLLLGPSGYGKSTLALALDGLIPHAVAELEGSVRVAGLDTATTA